MATRGTAAALAAAGVPVTPVNKVAEGRPHIVDHDQERRDRLRHQHGRGEALGDQDSSAIRREALTDQVPTYTTLAGANAAAIGMRGMRVLVPYAMQRLHERLR